MKLQDRSYHTVYRGLEADHGWSGGCWVINFFFLFWFSPPASPSPPSNVKKEVRFTVTLQFIKYVFHHRVESFHFLFFHVSLFIRLFYFLRIKVKETHIIIIMWPLHVQLGAHRAGGSRHTILSWSYQKA